MLQALALIFNISLLAAVFGFWPSVYIIYHYWGNGKDNFISRWFPILVVPWIASVGVFLTCFVILLFLVR